MKRGNPQRWIGRVSHMASCVMAMLVVGPTTGQDQRFTQAFMVPLAVDPALAGAINEREVALAHRDQRNGPDGSVRTDALGISLRASGRNRKGTRVPYRMGYGASVVRARSEDAGWNSTGVELMSACHVPIDERSWVGAGIGLGFRQGRINALDGAWGSQYDGMRYDVGLPSGEAVGSGQDTRINGSLGVVYVFREPGGTRSRKRELEVVAGAAVHHLGRAELSSAADGILPASRLYGGFARARIGLSKRLAVVPEGLLHLQGPHVRAQYGGALRVAMGPLGAYADEARPFLLALGAYHRPGDALIVGVTAEWVSFRFGISYDLPAPDAPVAMRMRRALEFAVGYAFNKTGLSGW